MKGVETMNNKTMTEQQAKIYVSKYIIPSSHGSNQNILRSLIFSLSSVEWVQVGAMIIHDHPELTQEWIDKNCVAN